MDLDRRPLLLPADRYLAAMLWPEDDPNVAAEKYRRFMAEVESQVRIDPAKPQAGAALGAIALVTGIISVGLTVVASFFKPKAPEPGSGGITATDKQGENIVATSRVAPKVGFDAVQQPSSLGMTIPVVWARRQQLAAQSNPPRPAGYYGGVRVNLGLIWSQMWTYRGTHLLRAVFLLGEGTVGLPDPEGYAIGDNSLSPSLIQDSAARALVSRATIYVNPSSGPIKSEHNVSGRSAANDVANSMNYGAEVVFSIRDAEGNFQQDFSYTTKPSTNTRFGVYTHIPNYMGIRHNPRIRPTIRVTTKSKEDGEKFDVDCDDDPQALAEHWKARYMYSMRGGIISTSTGSQWLYPGDRFRYKLERRSDADTTFKFDRQNTDNTITESDGEVTCADIANVVASKQRAADDALIIGELYKVGSCLAVLIEREPNDRIFVSDADNEPIGSGQTMEYVFQVVREGRVIREGTSGIGAGLDYFDPSYSGDVIKPPRWYRTSSLNQFSVPSDFYTCSDFPQIFRCAIASFSLARSARVFEVGIKSTVGMRINGLCNFRDCQSLAKINSNAGLKYNGRRFDKNDKIGTTIFQSGTVQRTETRISFFRIEFRQGNDPWQSLGATWGIKSSSSEAIFNELRFEMLTARRWEIRIEPVTSYEMKHASRLEAPYCVINSKSGQIQRTFMNNGICVEWRGEIKNRERRSFNLRNLDPTEDIGIPKADENSFIDDWAMIAEAFVYPEIETTINSGPEHEIVYVNTISTNAIVPTYQNIATVGLNIFSSTEFNQLSQFSAYMTDGVNTRRLREGDAVGSTHLFPDILRAYLANRRYGRGALVGDTMIDKDSFIKAADFVRKRRYFYDGVDASRVNLLQWAADTASYHLLELNQRGGKWALSQAFLFPENGPVPIRALFTAGNIVENSFRLQFIPESERQTVRMSVKWREERQRSDYTSSGFFPVEREVFVQEAGQSDQDPIESLDLSQFCTNVEHAIDVACYFIRMRRMVTHTISFSTTPDGLSAGLAAGDYIKVAMDMTYFDQFSNGVITEDGTILSTRNDLLTPGVHSVMAWDGASDFIYDTTITVDQNNKATPRNIVFAKRSTTTDVRVYKVEKISISEDGVVDIEAVHHPCDLNDICEIGKGWTTYQSDENWTIDGNEVEADFCTCPLVQGRSTPGSVLSVGSVICNSGTAITISVQWFRDYAPIQGATGNSYTFTSADNGATLFAEITYETTLGVVRNCRAFAQQSDVLADSVVLLLHMNGELNSTAFRDSSPYSHATYNASPSNAYLVRWNSRFGGSSALYANQYGEWPYFDHPTAFSITSTEDFTMECWIYRYGSFGRIFSAFGWDVSLSGGAVRAVSGSTTLQTSVIPGSQWVHIAVVRSSGTASIYIDGISGATGLSSSPSSQTRALVGGGMSSLSAAFYQDEVRLTKGIARYNGTFTVPQEQFLPLADENYSDESVVVLLHFDGTNGSTTFLNSTAYTPVSYPIQGGNATHCYISSAQSKFGSSSLYLSAADGTFMGGGSIFIRNVPAPGLQDFTVDCWIRPSAKAGTVFYSTYGNCYFIGGVLNYQIYADGANRFLSFETVSSISANDWSHVALTREGSTFKCFLNGKLSASYTAISNPYIGPQATLEFLQIGGSGGFYNSSLFPGHIDEFRVVMNKAMWTSEFDPPTQPYQDPIN